MNPLSVKTINFVKKKKSVFSDLNTFLVRLVRLGSWECVNRFHRPDSAKPDAVFFNSARIKPDKSNSDKSMIGVFYRKNYKFNNGFSRRARNSRTVCAQPSTAGVAHVPRRPSTERRNNNDIVLLLRNSSNLPYFRRVRRATPSTIRHRSTRRMRKQPTRSRPDVSKRVTGNSPAFGRQTVRLQQMARHVKPPGTHHTCRTSLNHRFLPIPYRFPC